MDLENPKVWKFDTLNELQATDIPETNMSIPEVIEIAKIKYTIVRKVFPLADELDFRLKWERAGYPTEPFITMSFSIVLNGASLECTSFKMIRPAKKAETAEPTYEERLAAIG